MAEGERERVGGVVGERNRFVESECAAHHIFHLGLAGMTVASD
jgi:hypothetical protein